MKVILHYRAGPKLREQLASLATASLRIVVVDERDDAAFAREIADADVLLHVLKPVTRSMLTQAHQLRLIQKIGVGLNTIDRAEATARGIRIANMPGTNTQAVAEHTLALMLAVLRRTVLLDTVTRKGEGWTVPPEMLESSGEIGGRIVGFIGFGAVPRRLTPVLRALGTRILYHSRTPLNAAEQEFRSLESLLREADIVSLHLPLNTSTRHLLGPASLELMKDNAVLINTARGELIDEAALVHALRRGRLRGAGLDVFGDEPAVAANPLFALPNVVVSPHIAWLTAETIERSLRVAFDNCRRLENHEPLLHEIVG